MKTEEKRKIYEEALSIIMGNIDYLKELELPEDIISRQITFENAHIIAYNLAIENPEAAKSILEELMFWRNKERI